MCTYINLKGIQVPCICYLVSGIQYRVVVIVIIIIVCKIRDFGNFYMELVIYNSLTAIYDGTMCCKLKNGLPLRDSATYNLIGYFR